MRRPAWFAVIASVLLLAGLVALKRAMSADDESSTSAPAAQAATPSAAPLPPEVDPWASAPALGPDAPPAPRHAAASAAPNTPVLPEIVSAITPTKKNPPIANKALLREQVAAVAPEVLDCVKQASFTGSGSAVLTYLVAPDKQKQYVAVESTGVEYDGTTLDNQPLLDCLKDTAKDMKFKYTPDTDSVLAFRRVKFDGGKLVENAFMDFHYVR